jgi:fused signal recognition particle receptor
MNSTQIVGLVIAIALVAGVWVFLRSRKKPKRVTAFNQVAEPIAQSASLPQIEIPEATDQRANRLKDRLTKSQSGISGALKNLFNSSDLSESDWTNLEDELILADVGAKASVEIVEKLRSAVKLAGSAQAANLKDVANLELTKLVDGNFDRSLKVQRKNDAPAVVLTVGVNGTGKTTTTGKLARMLTGQDLDVLLGAADTFRAAAAEQLITWGDRVGVPVVRGAEGSDPASVAFEAVKTGIENEVDVVLIDTAGRLHTKQGLMDELGKVHRVASKSTSIDEVLLVIDATTGQNGLAQARVFAEVVPVTGVVLTKLDGTAKGGIVIAIQQELGVPVKLVGLGEGPDDLAPFDAKQFVDGLLNA